MTKKRISAAFATSLALLFLFNANFNLLDVLPDCISYILLIYVIGDASNIVPYLAECKSALGKLTLVSAIRVPTFFLMYRNLYTGSDIVPMFTLIFVTLESILLYSAIENGYKALSYLGERTDFSTTVQPFSINRKGKTMSLFALKILTMMFFLTKGILNLIPDLFMLTPEKVSVRKKLAEAFPAVLIICMLTVTVVGIIWLRYSKKYLKAVRKSGDIVAAINSLKTEESPEVKKMNTKMKSATGALTMLAISSLFTFDLIFTDVSNLNLLPHFIYGLVLFYAVFNLTDNKKLRTYLAAGTAAFTVTGIVSYILLHRFFEKYNYLYLRYSKLAREMYLPVKVLAVLEALSVIAMLAISAIIFVDFIKKNTGTSPDDESYSITSYKMHHALTVKGFILFGLCAVINIVKCVNVFLKGNVKIVDTQINEEGFSTGSLPWVGTLIFFLCLVFVIYSFYFISEVKNEVKFKYSKEEKN